jgi:hypothetical protein
VTSQSFLKGLGKTFVHKSFPKSFFENHSMGQALVTMDTEYRVKPVPAIQTAAETPHPNLLSFSLRGMTI